MTEIHRILHFIHPTPRDHESQTHRAYCAIHASFISLLIATAQGQNLDLGQAGTFGILGLENGTVIINSATRITGDVGYSDGVVSTNQKAEDFAGGAYVHSGATFSYTDKDFLPSDGILSGPLVDSRLDQANLDALLFAATVAGLSATQTFGFLGDDDSVTINSTGSLNVIDIGGINYNSDAMTLRSRTGLTDTFIIRVAGNMDFSQSGVILDGLTAANVLFYFPTASSILINKDSSEFRGTILAPTGSVEYHNPAIFEGAIIAKDINVHSMFNLEHTQFVPEPGMMGFALARISHKAVGKPRKHLFSVGNSVLFRGPGRDIAAFSF